MDSILLQNSNIFINFIQNIFLNIYRTCYITGGYAFYLYTNTENLSLLPHDVDLIITTSYYDNDYIIFLLQNLLDSLYSNLLFVYDYLSIYLVVDKNLYSYIMQVLLQYYLYEGNYDKDFTQNPNSDISEKFIIYNNEKLLIKLKIKFSDIINLQQNNIYNILVIEFKKNNQNVILPFEIIIKNDIEGYTLLKSININFDYTFLKSIIKGLPLRNVKSYYSS